MGATARQCVRKKSVIDKRRRLGYSTHQANIRIIQTLCDSSGIGQDKAFINIKSMATRQLRPFPLRYEALEQGRIKADDNML